MSTDSKFEVIKTYKKWFYLDSKKKIKMKIFYFNEKYIVFFRTTISFSLIKLLLLNKEEEKKFSQKSN